MHIQEHGTSVLQVEVGVAYTAIAVFCRLHLHSSRGGVKRMAIDASSVIYRASIVFSADKCVSMVQNFRSNIDQGL